jgi:hypothetical protein
MKEIDIMFSYEIKKELACEMIEYIENYGIQDMYLCDVSGAMYNNDYYMIGVYKLIGVYKCKEWLKKYFDDMLEVIEYWEEETGEPYGQMITDVEKLATLVAYTVIDNLLYEAYDYIGLDSDEICEKSDEQEIYEYLLNEYK